MVLSQKQELLLTQLGLTSGFKHSRRSLSIPPVPKRQRTGSKTLRVLGGSSAFVPVPSVAAALFRFSSSRQGTENNY
jgi:hypothetical protein